MAKAKPSPRSARCRSPWTGVARATAMNVGVGLRYDMNSSLGLRVEYARFGRFVGEVGTTLCRIPTRSASAYRCASDRTGGKAASPARAGPLVSEPAPNVASFRGSIMRDSVGATVSLVYLARLREAFGAAAERIEAPPEVNTVGALARLAGKRGAGRGRSSSPRVARCASPSTTTSPRPTRRSVQATRSRSFRR